MPEFRCLCCSLSAKRKVERQVKVLIKNLAIFFLCPSKQFLLLSFKNSARVPISWLPTQIPVILDAKLAMKKKSFDHTVVSFAVFSIIILRSLWCHWKYLTQPSLYSQRLQMTCAILMSYTLGSLDIKSHWLKTDGKGCYLFLDNPRPLQGTVFDFRRTKLVVHFYFYKVGKSL